MQGNPALPELLHVVLWGLKAAVFESAEERRGRSAPRKQVDAVQTDSEEPESQSRG